MLATAEQYRSCVELIERHDLGEGSNQGTSTWHAFRQFYPVATPELHADLERLDVEHKHSTADNPNHPDYGKPILIFTLVPPLDDAGRTITTVAELDKRRAEGKRDDGRPDWHVERFS